MQRTELYPSIDDIVFRVAVVYENLYRVGKLDYRTASPLKRQWFMSRTLVGHLKKSPSELVIYVVVAPYILKRNGEYYFFEGVPIGKEFRLNGTQISFSGKPKVYREEHHNQPFVLSDNELCDDHDGRWSKPPLDIQWGLWYDISQYETIRKIANWLEAGRKLLQNGYFGAVNPVHGLNIENFASEHIPSTEALSKGVKIIEVN